MNKNFINSLFRNRLMRRFCTFVTTKDKNNNNWYGPMETGKLCGGDYVVVKCADKTSFQKLFESSDSDSELFKSISSMTSEEVVLLEQEMRIGLGEGPSRVTSGSRLNTFLGGRVALRDAVKKVTGDALSVLEPVWKSEQGGPLLPDTISGSISHKMDLAVGVALKRSVGRDDTIGVDLEKRMNPAADLLQRRLLTEAEQLSLGRLLPEISIDEEVLLRFSFKESVFKALSPRLQRQVDFAEVEVYPHRDGTAILFFKLKTKELFEQQCEWVKMEPYYWLTCVRLYDKHYLTCD